MGFESSHPKNGAIKRTKILLVGLAKAGKTSIYLRCFEKAELRAVFARMCQVCQRSPRMKRSPPASKA